MPRKVDYASRFHFFREAAFAIVRDRGVAALSRRALADELGISRNRVDDLLRAEADLRVLAADEVGNRRTTGRFHLSRGEPEEIAVRLVTSLMPDEAHRVDEELVWLRLQIEGPAAVAPYEDPDGPLWARYQIAERGFVHTPRHGAATHTPDGETEPPDESTPDRMADQLTRRDQAVTETLRLALEHLGLEQDDELPRLRALVDGLTLGVCLGRSTPEDAVAVVRAHLVGLGRAANARDGHGEGRGEEPR